MNKRFVEYTQKRWEQQNVVFPQPVNKNLYTKKMQNHQTYGSLPITSTDKISFNNFFGIRIKNVSYECGCCICTAIQREKIN